MKVTLTVHVFNPKATRVAKATVSAHDEDGKSFRCDYRTADGAYATTLPHPGRYSLKVTAQGMEAQTRDVVFNPGSHDETFVLGAAGLPFFYRGQVKVPFERLDDLLGVVQRDTMPEDKARSAVLAIAKRLDLKRVKGDANLQRNGLLVFRLPPGVGSGEASKYQAEFAASDAVALCAPVLKLPPRNATLLTNGLVVRWHGHVTEEQADATSRRFGLEHVRSIPYAGNAYQYRLPGLANLKLLDICEELVRTGLVEYAEPDLWHTTEDDQIIPTDWLYPEQWDHPIINVPEAWQELANVNAARTFGDPDVIIAVVDSGVNAAHMAFSGNVSSGAAKVYQLFDFVNMVANNNALGGDHGTCCAGAAAGRANDASAVAGFNEGTAGIAGNCRLIGIRRPGAGGTETTYSDLYVWAAGFNPNSALAGFPAQITPGADVISNSFGVSIGSPISGLMRDCFDFLTTYGRGGKGVLLFNSVGNFVPRVDFTLQRPWAAYGRTIAVGATTVLDDGVTEGISQYSGFGPMLDFCAPSHDAYVGTVPVHNPPTNFGAFTPTILNTPTSAGGGANLPGRPTRQTTVSANTAAGTVLLPLTSVAGLATGQAVLVGNPGAAQTEGNVISAVNAALGHVLLMQPLRNAHAAATAVVASQADYRNDFGGTSYATPVCAGIAALMLSANRNLTWIEVRELMRGTALELDTANTNPVGRWRDAAGRVSSDPGYAGPLFSQWYGYGRVDAGAAVDSAVNYLFERDTHVRDNLADTGAGPSSGPFWEGVDIWVRNANDGVSPAAYATHANTVHQDPIFGQDNWVYVRYRNRGTQATFPFIVRVYLTHWSGPEFVYPADFQPTVRPSDPLPSPLRTGTYLIGEASVASLAAGAIDRVPVLWRSALVPPATVVVGGVTTTWHPCLLVEVSPQDGFTPAGPHVWQNNNLAQKNLSIAYPDSGAGDFSFASVAGNLRNRSKYLTFELRIKWPVPRETPLWIRFENKRVQEFLVDEIDRSGRTDLSVEKSRVGVRFRVLAKRSVKLTVPNVGLLPMLVGGSAKGLPQGSTGLIELVQSDDNGLASGGLRYEVRAAAARQLRARAHAGGTVATKKSARKTTRKSAAPVRAAGRVVSARSGARSTRKRRR